MAPNLGEPAGYGLSQWGLLIVVVGNSNCRSSRPSSLSGRSASVHVCASTTHLRKRHALGSSDTPLSARRRRRSCVRYLHHWIRFGCWMRSEPCSDTSPDSPAARKRIRLHIATLIWTGSWPPWPPHGCRAKPVRLTSRRPGAFGGGEHAKIRLRMLGPRSWSGWKASRIARRENSLNDCEQSFRVRLAKVSYEPCSGG